MNSQQSPGLLTDLLRDVSRSFYLTLFLLPGEIRDQIGLAYLLARATDTIADTAALPVSARLDALQALRERICGGRGAPMRWQSFAEAGGVGGPTPAERQLLLRLDEALLHLDGTAEGDRRRIQHVLETITGGQVLDLGRFGTVDAPLEVRGLELDADLDDYTYRVAGCVGEFWTEMCLEHLLQQDGVDAVELRKDGVRFGKGLQLVNILRDLPKDLAQGRCYLPAETLKRVGLTPIDLCDPGVWNRLAPAYQAWCERASEHLRAGWRYTCALPRRPARLRIACALPVLLGQRTLGRLNRSDANPLDPARRIKVPRSEVYGVLLQTLVCHPFPGIWERMGAGVDVRAGK